MTTFLNKQINKILNEGVVKDFLIGSALNVGYKAVIPIVAITNRKVSYLIHYAGWDDAKVLFTPASKWGSESVPTIGQALGWRSISAAYLGLLGYGGKEGYDKLTDNKKLVDDSVNMVNAVTSGDQQAVTDIASDYSNDTKITPDILDNSKFTPELEKSNSIFAKAKEIAIEYPRYYVPILVLTAFGLVYMKLKYRR